MHDLIEALNIFLKSLKLKDKNDHCPTHCEHDELWIMSVTRDDVSDQDHDRLYELGFYYDEDDESYKSFRFGSAQSQNEL